MSNLGSVRILDVKNLHRSRIVRVSVKKPSVLPDQISTAMNQVGVSAQKNLSSATQASLASRKLSSQSVALAGVVSSLEHLMFGRSEMSTALKEEAATSSARERYISLTEEYHPTKSSAALHGQSNGMRPEKSGLADDESFRPYVG
jgi:hypothetical protein